MITSKRQKICLIIEYLIAVYVLATNLINILYQLDIVTTHLWVMRETFWGPGLLVLLVAQYLLMSVNHNDLQDRVRPYVMGGTVAGIVSVGSLALNLLLVFVMGCLVLDRIQKAQNMKNLLRCGLITAVGIEVYSVIMIIAAAITGTPATGSGFLYSLLPDCLLIGAVIIQWLVENKEKIKWKYCPKQETVLRLSGCAMCLVAITGFLLYLVTTNIGLRKIQMSTEEVYLLENCEDTSYVLTAVKNEGTGEYELRFTQYTGANNQKVRTKEGADGLYHIEFLEPRKSLQVDVTEEGEAELSLASTTDIIEQKWIVEGRNARQGIYGFRQASNYPLSYDYAVDGKIGELVTAQREGEKCSGFKRVSTLESEFVTESVARYYEDFKPTILMETLLTLLGGWIWIVCVLCIAVLTGIWYARKELGDMIALAVGAIFVWLLAYGAVTVMGLLVVIVGVTLMNFIATNRKGLTKENEEENSIDWTGVSL